LFFSFFLSFFPSIYLFLFYPYFINNSFLLTYILKIGHANQWGEVKTKKSKKEAQKAKAATTVVSSHQQQSTTTPSSYHASPRDTKITQQRSHNDRVTRPGKGKKDAK
jgi:hypothetical protein